MIEQSGAKYYLFTDASVNNKTKIAYGAYLFITEKKVLEENYSSEDVVIVSYTDTSSTKMELQTLLNAFRSLDFEFSQLIVCTDSQNIINLEKRREKLEANNFLNKNGCELANTRLYREFFAFVDSMNCSFMKIKGHSAMRNKNTIAKCFAMVDKLSRKKMRDASL